MNCFPNFAPNSRKEWRLLFFQSNLRKEIRKLPKWFFSGFRAKFQKTVTSVVLNFFNQICEKKLETCRKFWDLWKLFVIIHSCPYWPARSRGARTGPGPRWPRGRRWPPRWRQSACPRGWRPQPGLFFRWTNHAEQRGGGSLFSLPACLRKNAFKKDLEIEKIRRNNSRCWKCVFLTKNGFRPP